MKEKLEQRLNEIDSSILKVEMALVIEEITKK